MTTRSVAGNARDRLLNAAAQLLDEAKGKPVSTRAVCDLAGVQAPTLYHHFGSKQGLFDAVVEYGFGQYIRVTNPRGGDPVDDLRHGWDDHVRYGLDNPSFYVLLYGRIALGEPCAVTSVAEAKLLELLIEIARQGRLRVTPAVAAGQFVAANVGMTLHLIAQPEGRADLALSRELRDNVIAGLIRPAPAVTSEASREVVENAQALADALDADAGRSGLSAGELLLMREWLDKLVAAT
ncbi:MULTISPECIES: TetR/AcrR family transcriptional regulator [unclassified Rhodococcus (in: high G+C Gram-positive bacteria)]|uniref:TetR/AcrR family transcriptional regulator n=1 Tax=unclassified Rhodococcus (in: high G+C Gram-positive bacteria) TaxID=192944 RepID=UPI001ED8EF68|nr:TetR/AcrR family transcriptional regulator [Rhodococcus sp. DK17]